MDVDEQFLIVEPRAVDTNEGAAPSSDAAMGYSFERPASGRHNLAREQGPLGETSFGPATTRLAAAAEYRSTDKGVGRPLACPQSPTGRRAAFRTGVR
jgi:hypothetical protein